jgi:hypothetical protein
VYLDESAAAVPHSKNALDDLHLAPSLVKLPERDDVVLEAWYVEHIGQLDLLAGLAGEGDDLTPLNWDNRTIIESHSTLYCTIEHGEGRRPPCHVACRTSVEVPALNLVGVAICAQEDMSGWLVQL